MNGLNNFIIKTSVKNKTDSKENESVYLSASIFASLISPSTSLSSLVELGINLDSSSFGIIQNIPTS